MFQNRAEAGQRLARSLNRFKDQNALVFAIPHGGVEVGYQVANFINADLSVLVARKLSYPDKPDTSFGAIAEDSSVFISPYVVRTLSSKMVDSVVARQQEEINQCVETFRQNQPLPDVRLRTVILVSDGITMGLTMRVCVMLCRKKGADKIVIASPVADPDTACEMTEISDDTVILKTPRHFRTPSQVYNDRHDPSDTDVLDTMQKWQLETMHHVHEVG